MKLSFKNLTEEQYVEIKRVASRHKVSLAGRGRKLTNLEVGVQIAKNFTTCIIKRKDELYIGQVKYNPNDLIIEDESLKTMKAMRINILRQTNISGSYREAVTDNMSKEINRKTKLAHKQKPKPEIGIKLAFNRAVYEMLDIKESHARHIKKDGRPCDQPSKARARKSTSKVSKSK